MKNLLLGSALALSTLAVVMPTQNAMAQEVATVGSIGNGLDWLAKRIYSIDVGTLAHSMEMDGVSERKYIGVFGISGALIQNFELAGSDVGLDEVSRKVGMQILPYTVKISTDGRKFISVAAFALKDMNKAYETVGTTFDPGHFYGDGDETIEDNFWTVVNNIEALVYEYDDGLMINNTETHRLDLLRAETKLDILGSSEPGNFLAIVAKVGIGYESQVINTPNNGLINLKDTDGEGIASRSFNLKTAIGLEYNLPLGDESSINASAFFNWNKFSGFNYIQRDKDVVNAQNEIGQNETNQFNGALESQYNNAVSMYESNKEQYEQDNFNGQSISDESYQQLSGNSFPVLPSYREFEAEDYKPRVVRRTLMYVSPNVKFTGKMGAKTGYEINVFGNIPITDSVNGGGLNIDLSNTNARPIIGAGIKLKF